jgi:hypothetical protein
VNWLIFSIKKNESVSSGMVSEFDDVIETATDGNPSIPLPIGSKLDRHTVSVSGIRRMAADNFEVIHQTGSGWPTVIRADRGELKSGIAFIYSGDWHECPHDEIDLQLMHKPGTNPTYHILVSFGSLDEAIDTGRYEIEGYHGYEVIEESTLGDYSNIEGVLAKDKTPIIHKDSGTFTPAVAVQFSDSYATLEKMFDLENSDTLQRRHTQLRREILPRELLWEDEDDPRDRLQHIYDSVADSE